MILALVQSNSSSKMNSEIELLHKEIAKLKQKIHFLENRSDAPKIPTYQYSKIRDRDLQKLFEIEQNLDHSRFDSWFRNPIELDQSIKIFLTELLDDNKLLIERYNEEDLKANFLIPLLNKIRFKSYEKKLRDFYEVPMTYTTSTFEFNGNVDFMVAEGLVENKKPYFFIQEFKRSEEYGNPRPQLLAELISALELNDWTTIKGAYIIGGSWHFVILEKLADEHYQYFISPNFDSTKLDDLISIYQHLLAVKHEIFLMLKKSQH